MTREEIAVGLLVRVVHTRWDAPVGTVGRVNRVGSAGTPQGWCFAVE